MRVIIQRVKYAKCHIDNQVYSEINQGFMCLVGIKNGDTAKEVEKVAKKVIGMRIFDDAEGKMNLNLAAVNGEVLSISQFTLYGDSRKGNRPSFVEAMKPPVASDLYDYFNQLISEAGIPIKTGIFGAEMQIEMINDGTITIILDSEVL